MSKSRNRRCFAKLQQVFLLAASDARLHQARGRPGGDEFLMIRDMVAMRVRDKRKRLLLPRIEPQPVIRKFNAALVVDSDHGGVRYAVPSDRQPHALGSSFLFVVFVLLSFLSFLSLARDGCLVDGRDWMDLMDRMDLRRPRFFFRIRFSSFGFPATLRGT